MPQICDNGNIIWKDVNVNEVFAFDYYIYDGGSARFLGSGKNIQLSGSGYAVWETEDIKYGFTSELMLFNGSTTSQITNDSYENHDPRINSVGHVTWHQLGVIYIYDGSTSTKISMNSSYNQRPQINDGGYVVWDGIRDGEVDREIFLYNGSTEIQLTTNSISDRDPKINNNGQVAWLGYDGTSLQVFFYDGYSISQLTNDVYNIAFSEDMVQINDSGHVVWESRTGPDYADYEIFLYDGSSTIQLTNNSYQDSDPRINNNGTVVWYGYQDGYGEIFMYNGSEVLQLTDNDYHDVRPHINNNDEVVWYSSILEDPGPPPNYQYDIYLATPAGVPKLVRIAGSTPAYYSTLQDAYNAAEDGDIIEARNIIFNENLYINDMNNKSVTLNGGYNSYFSAITGASSIIGNMIINNGAIILSNIVLR